MPQEFNIIHRYFKPLATSQGALSLQDDVALYQPATGMELVLTQDAMVEGIHFLSNMEPDLIAKRLICTTISDLAAKGAEPKALLLTLGLASYCDEVWLESFASGFAEDCKRYALHVLGGDTVVHQGPLFLSLTAIGEVSVGQALLRSGARPGDVVCVSGTLGKAAVGLALLQGESLNLETETNESCIAHYQTPEPRIGLGKALRGVASACMDISDGLIQDLEHLCRASSVGASLQLGSIPRVKVPGWSLERTIGFGDDYELLFTVPAHKVLLLEGVATQQGLSISQIGVIHTGSGVVLLDSNQQPIALDKKGFEHGVGQ